MSKGSEIKKLTAVSQHYVAGVVKLIGDEYDADAGLAAELVGIGRANYSDKLTDEQKEVIAAAKAAKKDAKGGKKE